MPEDEIIDEEFADEDEEKLPFAKAEVAQIGRAHV